MVVACTYERLHLRCAKPYDTDVTPSAAIDLRRSLVAETIRRERLLVVLRRIAPQPRLVALVEELADAGARVFEITFDAPTAAADIAACRATLGSRPGGILVGAGTLRTTAALAAALAAGADFGVSPILDRAVLDAALERGLPFVPGAFSPTEIDAAWRAGATFVKLFPASSVGPDHVRELRGPLGDIELIPTGGIDAASAPAFLAAGAVAVGIGGALVNAAPAARRAILESVRRTAG